MLFEKRNVFVTTEDIVFMSHEFEIPSVRHHTDWTIDLYLKFIEFLKSNKKSNSEIYSEILVKLKCDILNNLSDFSIFVSPCTHPDGDIGYAVFNKHTTQYDHPRQITDVIVSIESKYNEYYKNYNDITIFDIVKLNKPSSENHGMEYMIVGLATEDSETLYKMYGINGNVSHGYVSYGEVSKL